MRLSDRDTTLITTGSFVTLVMPQMADPTDPDDGEPVQTWLTDAQRAYLNDEKGPGETYADAMARVIELAEKARKND